MTARDRLLSLGPAGLPVPSSGGWAVSADLLLYLVELVRRKQPSRIVELGSGISTCWLAWALDAFTAGGMVVSLEHLGKFRDRTLRQLQKCGVDQYADVRLAPLIDMDVNGSRHSWYDPAAWCDLSECDLLVVDGPPGRTAAMARYPAVPLLGSILRPGASVVLDDHDRPDEQKAVAEWHRDHPGWKLRLLEHEKGTAVLEVPDGPRHSEASLSVVDSDPGPRTVD